MNQESGQMYQFCFLINKSLLFQARVFLIFLKLDSLLVKNLIICMIHLLPHVKIRPCFCCVLPECKFEDQIHKDTLCGKICVVLFIVFYEFLFLHICVLFSIIILNSACY